MLSLSTKGLLHLCAGVCSWYNVVFLVNPEKRLLLEFIPSFGHSGRDFLDLVLSCVFLLLSQNGFTVKVETDTHVVTVAFPSRTGNNCYWYCNCFCYFLSL